MIGAVPQSSNSPTLSPRDTLSAAYDTLNALWKDAEVHLGTFSVCIPIEIDIGMNRFLSWRRLKNWRIALGIRQDDDSIYWRPLLECPIIDRIDMVVYFTKLQNEIKKARIDLGWKLQEAATALNNALGLPDLKQ